MSESEYYAGEFDDADLDALAAAAGEHYLDESGFFLMPTQNEMRELAEIGDTLLFLDRFRLFRHSTSGSARPRHE